MVLVFSEYQAAVSAAGSQNVPMECARRLDGALLAVGSLSEILKTKVRNPGHRSWHMQADLKPC